MDIFSTNIPEAIRKGHLQEGAFICRKDGVIVKLGSFTREIYQNISTKNKQMFFKVDDAKARKAVADHLKAHPDDRDTVEVNIRYLQKIDRWSTAPAKEELRARVKEAGREFFGS